MMMDMESVKAESAGRGFDMIEHLRGTTYRDVSTVVLVPTRGMIHNRCANAIHTMIAPMNAKRALLYCEGDEVGHAYNRMIRWVLDHPDLSKWRYVLTVEDDNLPPPDAHVRLIESIEAGPFDGVGALYFTKGEGGMPMCYGDPVEYARTGVLDFRPRDIRSAVQHGQVVECNGIAMGCTLYRMELFRELEAPWFVTVADVVPGGGAAAMTQDLYFCERARRKGKRFATDCRVRVGHMDTSTGIVW